MTYDDAGSGLRTTAGHDRQEGCLDRPDPLPTRVDGLPDLPATYAAALDAALTALGISLEPPAREAIDAHVRLLLAWNAAINLTAVRDPAEIAVRHVADSLTGLAALRAAGADRFVDLGSGGGFPGLPLAAALPADRALLVDSVAKKARFLAAAASATRLASRVQAVASRAEGLAADRAYRGRWPAVVARAVASLADLVELGLPLLRADGVLIAWKSGWPNDAAGLGAELAAARRAVDGIGGGGAWIDVGPAVADLASGGGPAATAAVAAIADHRLVIVRRGRRPIADAWPRDPAARRRRPW